MGHLRELSRRANIVLGLMLVIVLVSAAAISVALYRGTFSDTQRVTMYADRAGLLLERNSSVELNGVVVGRVQDVEFTDNRAKLTLGIDSTAAQAIPSNVTADVDPMTLLGRKYVRLTQPANPRSDALRSGDVLWAPGVGHEVDDLLSKLVDVLDEVDPQRVTTTVGGLSQALADNGQQVGTLVDQLNDYLAEFNPNLGALQRDMVSGAAVANRLDEAAPDLLATIDRLSVTSTTLTREQRAFSAFVLSFSNLGATGRDFFSVAGMPFERAVKSLRTTVSTLGEFAPIYPCFLSSLALTNQYLERANGGSDRPGLNVVGTLLMGNPPYSSSRNLPKVGLEGVAPSCRQTSKPPAHIDFDDGSDAYGPINGPADLIGNPLADLLFGGH
ncbi:MCE family protein [Gordonia otitidis]|uniref:Mce family protein n=1 Tax=Gordonia otitidis (strain DSM 44809 / CCUG 52243 / JCM 12355 / NBRC 100426 / IFM 10032) TaxID=1108044 RepID=H5TSA7_GORO1|nr:MCE family protein [Gordonia otitidis]GAB36365.1 Mce family protein [Gordonia otitidis NBRC 100426]